MAKRARKCKAAAVSQGGRRCRNDAKHPRPHNLHGKLARCKMHQSDKPDWNQNLNIDYRTVNPPFVRDSNSDQDYDDNFEVTDEDVSEDESDDTDHNDKRSRYGKSPLLDRFSPDRRSTAARSPRASSLRTRTPTPSRRVRSHSRSRGSVTPDRLFKVRSTENLDAISQVLGVDLAQQMLSSNADAIRQHDEVARLQQGYDADREDEFATTTLDSISTLFDQVASLNHSIATMSIVSAGMADGVDSKHGVESQERDGVSMRQETRTRKGKSKMTGRVVDSRNGRGDRYTPF
ncbi:hypothetical protein P153DRAFT_391425 [Dothidotthia symphoricarpi CBS 119687]|uniref:Uncharacterized protein n=1 Tax=Dothidotthia symphoricarpi CBS 119687 TaxID=1392245 RepID=A0A6A5ZYV3_9PLEO|nr:uncharacterized protein P153DRAFT_391425 [Dothidotthia symphoricarpi CBS 119687]KAF2123588.1 hypothetical protein P153DRAFT_391425 [Dothidotthia symphoricarpi CBS 119687]